MIKEFRDKYRFLSNFWFTKGIEYEGKIYTTVEHAYQVAKFTDEELKEEIRRTATPAQAKRLARLHKSQIRENWEAVKVGIMFELIRKKFSDPELAKKLLDTGDEQIQEGNTWGDKFWGVDLRTGKGENTLGEILKVVRFEILYK